MLRGGRGSKSVGGGSSSVSSARATMAIQSALADAVDAQDNANPDAITIATHGAEDLDVFKSHLAKTQAELEAMTDTEFAQYVAQTQKIDMPNFMPNADTQRFIYAMGLNKTPEVVDTASFNKISGTTFYRTVNQFYDSKNDVGMTAPQIMNQMMKGSLSRIGAGTYGDGYYFADNKSGSSSYGRTSGNVKATAQVRMKLNSNARAIDYSTLMNMYRRSKNAKTIGSISDMYDNRRGGDGSISVYALKKGYNVIRNGSYINVIDRSAMTIENKINPI